MIDLEDNKCFPEVYYCELVKTDRILHLRVIAGNFCDFPVKEVTFLLKLKEKVISVTLSSDIEEVAELANSATIVLLFCKQQSEY